ncbi:uncharacterized protein LOC121282075 [Carcharodon carcharias]|uniref:uncharacterized protein LOC121282075 n=1 Tax=Carcharodon carcharias TaxID=13397 RepID=UPI001B7F00DD|nr:uncharacterized protein LOC121282075 [Carcharodon carcharias]
MKKSASFWKPQALCCLCLALLLPVAATGKWCNNPNNFKWLTEELQDEINNLNDNLLPSMVKYSIFTNVNSAELTDHCFIVITSKQLNNTLLLLMSHFRENSYTYNQTQLMVKYLAKLYKDCSDESSLHQCLKPATKVVTACRSDLFAYFQAILNHYKYIFDQCNLTKQPTEQSEGYRFFLEASNITGSSNCSLIDLHSGSYSNNSYTNSSTQPSYNVRTVVGNTFTSKAEARSTVTSVVTKDNSVHTATNKNASVGIRPTNGPPYTVGNSKQTEVNNSGTVPDTLSAPSSAASPSQTVSEPTGAEGTASPHQDKQHMNSQLYLCLFIGTLVALVLALCAIVHLYFKLKRLQQGYGRAEMQDHDENTRESSC